MINTILRHKNMADSLILWLGVVIFSFACSSQKVNSSKTVLTGEDFSSWQNNTGEWFVCGSAFKDSLDDKRIDATPGTGIMVNGADGRTENILSREEFGDVIAHVEFMVPKGSNSGIYFMGRYEIQVLDSWGKEEVDYSDAGGIYQRWDENREPKGYEGVDPGVNAARQPGEWQEFDIIFDAPRFDTNGK